MNVRLMFAKGDTMEKRNFSFVESKKFVEVQMNPLKTESKVKAMVSVQFYELNGDKKGKFTNSFSGLKLIEVKKGEFILAEPGNNYKDNAGEWVNSP